MDICAILRKNVFLQQGHVGVVEDVAWHVQHEYLFGSVGDDRQLLVWDTRTSTSEKPLHAIEAHQAEVSNSAFISLTCSLLFQTTGLNVHLLLS